RQPEFSIFAHVSRSPTVRLNTGWPVDESRESTQKYPLRSNWKRAPGEADASDGSSRAPVSTVSEFGFSAVRKSSSSSGLAFANSVSYSRTSASTACGAQTQWIVPFPPPPPPPPPPAPP